MCTLYVRKSSSDRGSLVLFKTRNLIVVIVYKMSGASCERPCRRPRCPPRLRRSNYTTIEIY